MPCNLSATRQSILRDDGFQKRPMEDILKTAMKCKLPSFFGDRNVIKVMNITEIA
jgi:hypothetical protein